MSAVTCDREATTPQAKCNATLRAAVLFGAGFVARSLQIASDMRLARASPAPKIPCRERLRIYAHQYLAMRKAFGASSPCQTCNQPDRVWSWSKAYNQIEKILDMKLINKNGRVAGFVGKSMQVSSLFALFPEIIYANRFISQDHRQQPFGENPTTAKIE